MDIGQLFVSIGLKGADVAKKGISGIATEIKGVASTSLEAKAALVGMLFGLEQLMAGAMARTTGLTQIATILGLDEKGVQDLQKWSYAAKKYLGSDSELQKNVVSMQQKFAEMHLTGNAPRTFGIMADKVGLDVERASKDFDYMLTKVEEFVKLTGMDPVIKGQFLKDLGGENLQYMMAMHKASDDIRAKQLSLSPNQIKIGAQLTQNFNDFKAALDMKMSGWVLKFGPSALATFTHAFSGANKVVKDLEKHLGKDGVLAIGLSGLGLLMLAAFGPIGPIVAGIVALLAQIDKHPALEKLLVSAGEYAGDAVKLLNDKAVAAGVWLGSNNADTAIERTGKFGKPTYNGPDDLARAAERSSARLGAGGNNTTNIQGGDIVVNTTGMTEEAAKKAFADAHAKSLRKTAQTFKVRIIGAPQ